MNIVERYESSDPWTSAYVFSTVLAFDLGVQSTITEIEGGYAVTADDGKSVVFTNTQEKTCD